MARKNRATEALHYVEEEKEWIESLSSSLKDVHPEGSSLDESKRKELVRNLRRVCRKERKVWRDNEKLLSLLKFLHKGDFVTHDGKEKKIEALLEIYNKQLVYELSSNGRLMKALGATFWQRFRGKRVIDGRLLETRLIDLKKVIASTISLLDHLVDPLKHAAVKEKLVESLAAKRFGYTTRNPQIDTILESHPEVVSNLIRYPMLAQAIFMIGKDFEDWPWDEATFLRAYGIGLLYSQSERGMSNPNTVKEVFAREKKLRRRDRWNRRTHERISRGH